MPTRHHLYLFYLATTVWTAFFLGGLWSNYYQSWHWVTSLLLLVIAPVVVLVVLTKSLLRSLLRDIPALRGSMWVAFYLTVPLFAYDIIYLALHQRLGFSFIWSHWYLSALYVIPWLVLPIAGNNMQQKRMAAL